MVQDGSEINELPVIVRKVNDVVSFSDTAELPLKPTSEQDEQEEEAVSAIDRCHTLKSVYALLGLMPKEEVTPQVAVHALTRILDLENNVQLRNVESPASREANFTCAAVVSELIDIVATGEDSASVVAALKVASRDLSGCLEHKERLKNEVLVRATEGKLSVMELCESVRSLALLGSEDVDKLWVGFVAKENEINETNILDMFRVLPSLRECRHAIFQMLERRLIGKPGIWWQLSPRQAAVGEILALMKTAKLSSVRLFVALSKWTNVNVHILKPEHLNCIVAAFTSLNYSDDILKTALERFVKANVKKNKSQPQILDHYSLYANIMAHISKFRHRSDEILDGGSQMFVKSANLTPSQITNYLSPFGMLNYTPKNSEAFWKHLELNLDSKFAQFKPSDALDALLYCVYLQKYPLNFVSRVFNPHFLDRLSDDAVSQPQPEVALHRNRDKLQVLDTALTLECPGHYQGPLLPRSRGLSRPVWQDGRVRSMSFALRETLWGAERQATTSVLLSDLPANELFLLDLVVHPSECSWRRRQASGVDRSQCTVLLVHVPEHFSKDGKTLIGPQALRTRVLQHLGFKVARLRYDKLTRLRVHPQAFRQYVEEKLAKAALV